MLQAVMSANNLSYAAVLDIIKLLNLVIGTEKIPESIYYFRKVCSENIVYSKHWFCKGCERGFGTQQPGESRCPDCEKSTDYFISTPISSTLKTILTRNIENVFEYKQQLANMDRDVISDINNSAWHQKLVNRETTLTVNINTDGVSPYNSSIRSSLWPILITLNDLPPELRYQKKNVIAAGYWLSEIQPIMSIFLQPFIEEMNLLAQAGINICGRRYIIKVCGLCLDSPARSKLLCMKQFNGYHGCTFCLHPVINQRYPYMEAERRNLQSHFQNIAVWEMLPDSDKRRGVAINGVKGRTPLLQLQDFDPMQQVPVDFMHCALLGVQRLLLNLWFSPEFKNFDFNVNVRRRRIADARFKHMKTYSECTRKSNTLTDKSHKFKANELFNFLFYYSQFCLCAPVLEPEYFQHFMLFVDAMETLHSKNFKTSDVDACERKLNQFVDRFATLYGPQFMVYNVHLLTHIAETARLFGPLSTTSLFVFENTNGVLNKFLSGPKGPTVQICIRHYLYFTNHYFRDQRITHHASRFCKQILNKGHNKYKYTNDHRKSTDYLLPADVLNHYNEDRHFKSFKQYYIYNNLITTSEVSSKSRRYNDSYIFLNNQFFKIIEILTDLELNPNYFYIIGKQALVRTYTTPRNYYEIYGYSPVLLLKIESRFTKCIFFELNGIECLVQIRNSLIVN
jgi:cation transport regulator ChaB